MSSNSLHRTISKTSTSASTVDEKAPLVSPDSKPSSDIDQRETAFFKAYGPLGGGSMSMEGHRAGRPEFTKPQPSTIEGQKGSKDEKKEDKKPSPKRQWKSVFKA